MAQVLVLKIEPGNVPLPQVSNWKSEGTKATNERRNYFQALPSFIQIHGTTIQLAPDGLDASWRSGNVHVSYPARHIGDLAEVLKPFVLLEVGNARVTPFVPRDMSSFVHDHLASTGHLDGYNDNRPKGVRCVHPLVTLLEKLDALQRRVSRDDNEPASFVRHYEDSARIIAAEPELPPLPDFVDVTALAKEMLAQKQIAPPPGPDSPAFTLPPGARTEAIRNAYEAIGQMFWKPRQTLDETVSIIRAWLARTPLSNS